MACYLIQDHRFLDSFLTLLGATLACAYRLCHPNIVPMETAEPSD